MSRAGQAPLHLPSGVSATIAAGQLTVKGKLGELKMKLSPNINVSQEGQDLHFKPRHMSLQDRADWGTMRRLAGNMVKGVTEGYSITLEIVGVGYRAAVAGKNLELAIGYSHPVKLEIPAGLKVATPKPTQIDISGIDKQQVGAFAAKIRSLKLPEPYLGKGIKYEGEHIIRKEGKKK